MEQLESRIQYQFRDRRYLMEAMTHASLARKSGDRKVSNQRLEFLGDSVIQLVVSQLLFETLSDADEGKLTKSRSRLVSTTALAQVARRIGLGEFIMLDRGEENTGGRDRDTTLADAFEALIGAVFQDGGMSAGDRVLRMLIDPLVHLLFSEPGEENPKGQLQEKLQAINQETPNYKVVEMSGPDHQRWFHVAVTWGGTILGNGRGSSKKAAEMAAAGDALENWKKMPKSTVDNL